MKTITIYDKDATGGLSFDLIDILAVLGPDADQSFWELSGVEATGAGAEDLYECERQARQVAGPELRAIAARLSQVIEGRFSAHLGEGGPTWFIATAVDSTCWDIASEKLEVLEQFRTRFTDVRESNG